MGLTTVIFAGDADAATKASDEADRQLNLQQAIHSYGDVILTAGGAVREVSNSDLGVDVIADMLTITSGAGVSGIETSLDVIDSINNTNGDIILSDVDSIGESASGLTVNQITNTNGSVYINAPGSLDVLRINAPGASADITLHSGGVMNLLPVSGVPTTVTAGRNLIMSADGVLFLSSGFTAPNSVSFSSLADVKLSSTTLNLSTNEAITLQSNNSLIINGLLESAKGITLISNHGNVVMNGIIRGRNGQPLDSLTVIARGNLMTSGNYQGQYRFRSLIDDATYYGDAPELTGTSHVINATGQSVSNFESLNLVPFTTTGSAVAKDSATGMDIFRDPTDNQRYLRYISGQGEQFNRSNDPVTGYYPFSAVDLTTAQFIPLLYSTTADPKAGTLYAADKTTVIDPATVASFETELVPLTDSAVISRLVPLTQNDVSDSQPSGTSVTLINAAIGPVANSVTFIAQGQVQAPSLTLTGANSTISVLTSDNLTTGAWRAANITATSQGLFDSTGKFVGGNIIVPTSFKNSSNGNPKTVALTTLNDLTLDAPVSPTLSLLIHAGDAIVNPLSSITVGGAGSFIELASGSDLKITGDLTAAGPITLVSRGLSTGGGPLTGGSVIVSGNLTLGSGKLTVQTTDSDSEIFGTITGSGGLELLGTGVLTLDGTKTFGGQTTVTGGTLNVTGTTTASSPVVVSAGASLAGTGTVKGPVTVQNGGAIGPGPSVEQLTVNGNVSFAGGSNFAAKINGTTAITDYDQLNVLGTVTIGANVPLSLTSLNSFVPADGNAFLIISNDGNDPVVGTFMGLPEGAAVKNIFGSGVNASITYQGGTGNDVALLVDRTPPVVNSIVRSGTNPSKASSVNFVVTFSEPVTGVGVGDFVIDQVGVPQATIASVSGSGSTYTVTVNTGNGEGTLSIDFDKNADGSVQDAAGNLSVASFTAGGTFNVDTVLPRVTSIVLVNSNPTKAGPVAFTVTFNEPVTGLAANDFVIDQVGVTGATITNVTSSSGTTYTVTTTTGTGDGTLSIDFSATAGGGVQDAIGNTSTANFTAGENYIIDRTPPVVSSIVRANPNPTNLNSVDFTVTFNESVTGVGANDFVLHQTLLTGASITGISGSGTTYTVTVNSGTGEGSLWIDFDATAGGSVFDVALNMSAANFTGKYSPKAWAGRTESTAHRVTR
ncbi:MAG: hypothetical protein NT013_30255 [Planctomycetia bacterium]|nr:hypothetical protein [Planctomycetia bacterium]